MKGFAERLIAWQQKNGRHNLPWQNTADPYQVWVSEIMLQQTQVATVIDYFQKFMKIFPTVEILAAASEEHVLAQWAGLGYYTRARNLHRAAQQIMRDHGGVFPISAEGLATLPGIGRSTAAAIASFCFSERVAILDGNVKRVLARHAGVEGYPGQRNVELRLWDEAAERLPKAGEPISAYTQGMMDLGALICTRSRPHCEACPVAADCVAMNTGRTHELPTPRPSKKLPEKAVNLYFIACNDYILLEYRSRPGVWKGLWSLPEAEATSDTKNIEAYLQGWGIQIELLESLPVFQHVFSHYKLELRPWKVELSRANPISTLRNLNYPDGYAWKSVDELMNLGFPAPIRRFFDGWYKSPNPVWEN